MLTQELQGSKITLQLLNPRHIADYCAMFSSTVCAALHVCDVASERDYLYARLQDKELPFFYVIFDNKDHRLIGGVEIRSIDSSRGQLYSWMHERYWGGGRYQEALTLISKEYFSHNQERYFTAHVDVGNKLRSCVGIRPAATLTRTNHLLGLLRAAYLSAID